ncbi:MAG: NADH dehydrogenase subunit F [Actinomycetota bacterium]|nr:MAG: NADH dehydrogenase subunit F [Actinomycetota bacterium]
MSASPSDVERAAVDAVLGPPGDGDGRVARGGREVRGRRHLLLPALRALQARAGWVSPGGLAYVSERLGVPPAEAYGVASFYAMLSTRPRPPAVLHLCEDLACRLAGAEELAAELERLHGPEGEDRDGRTWLRSPCLGLCERAPAALAVHAGERPREVACAPLGQTELAAFLAGGDVDGGVGPAPISAPQTADPEGRASLVLLRRVGRVDPGSLDDYRAHGGYEALRTAVALGPQGVIRELKDAKLLGRGGAAFPTGLKWELVAQQPVRPHYVVANADESEPGTFKDRVLMEHDPFALIEALTIAGFTAGAERGYVYLRGEYPHAFEALERAVAAARARGFLGPDVMGAGFAFDIEIRRGAGAYIAGEETALFNSIEGRRAEPRNKPPFPATHGLFGKPTVINNVETLVNVLEVLRVGGPAYAEVGTPESTGTRLFCVSGDVGRPGVYEVPCGTHLAELLTLAGGVRGDGRPKAVLLGGAAGAFVGPEDLELPLAFESAREAGVTLGSGVVMVFGEGADLVDAVLRIAAFFRDESCGQCVPCRVGTVRQEEALRRLASGRTLGTREDELALLSDVAQVMRDASICGLGQTAANAVWSAISRLGVFG